MPLQSARHTGRSLRQTCALESSSPSCSPSRRRWAPRRPRTRCRGRRRTRPWATRVPFADTDEGARRRLGPDLGRVGGRGARPRPVAPGRHQQHERRRERREGQGPEGPHGHRSARRPGPRAARAAPRRRRDPADFGRAMGELAKRVPDVDAWELWNEEDSERWFARRRQPRQVRGDGQERLHGDQGRAAARRRRDRRDDGQQLRSSSSSSTPTGSRATSTRSATHTDTACLIDGPSRKYREPDGRLGRYIFSSYREVHEVMKRHGDGGKQIWMTELGWSTQSTRAELLHDRRLRRQEAARRHRGRAGRVPHAGLPVPAERPVHRRRLLVRPAGHPGRQLARRLRPVPQQRHAPSRRPPRSRRSRAASRPSRAAA